MRSQIEEAEVDVGGVEVKLLADDAPVLKVCRRRRFHGERLDGGQRSGSERAGDEKRSAAQRHDRLLFSGAEMIIDACRIAISCSGFWTTLTSEKHGTARICAARCAVSRHRRHCGVRGPAVT